MATLTLWVILFIIFMMVLCRSCAQNCWNYIVECYEYLSFFANVGWMGDFGEMNESNYYKNKNKQKLKIVGEMDRLIRELIKARYCEEVLNNPIMTEQFMRKRLENLCDLERIFPHLKRDYSPTQYEGYREDMAIRAYGEFWHDDWLTIRRTLWLTHPDGTLTEHPQLETKTSK